MFELLKSIDTKTIVAARRGRKVEEYYANIIGTIAFKYATNAGAKNSVQTAIRSIQTPGPGQTLRGPKIGTLKHDLFVVLTEILNTPANQFCARDHTKSHEDREKLSRKTATGFVEKFWRLRSTKA